MWVPWDLQRVEKLLSCPPSREALIFLPCPTQANFVESSKTPTFSGSLEMLSWVINGITALKMHGEASWRREKERAKVRWTKNTTYTAFKQPYFKQVKHQNPRSSQKKPFVENL